MSSPKTRKARPISTKTQAVSFDLQVYAVLEEQRVAEGMEHEGRTFPRSTYVRLALIERFKRLGKWPPKAKK